MKNTRIRASDEMKREFARRLKEKLIQHQMNQSELARRIDVSKDAVSAYMRARNLPSRITLKRIAMVFGCKPEDLLPKRYDYANEAPMDGVLSIQLLGGGMAQLFAIDLTAPADVLWPIFQELARYAPGISQHRAD